MGFLRQIMRFKTTIILENCHNTVEVIAEKAQKYGFLAEKFLKFVENAGMSLENKNPCPYDLI